MFGPVYADAQASQSSSFPELRTASDPRHQTRRIRARARDAAGSTCGALTRRLRSQEYVDWLRLGASEFR